MGDSQKLIVYATQQKSIIKIPTRCFYFSVNPFSDAKSRCLPHLKPPPRQSSKSPPAVQPCPKLANLIGK